MSKEKWGRIARNPDRVYKIVGANLRQQDLLTLGEMLEAESQVGTLRAAILFQAGPGGLEGMAWGRGRGGGNVLVPLRRGGLVDIDWLNTLMVVTPPDTQMATLTYMAGKLGWAVADGIAARKVSAFVQHLKAFGAPEEEAAAVLAGTYLTVGWKFADVLHPDVVELARQTLNDFRQGKEVESSIPQTKPNLPVAPRQGVWNKLMQGKHRKFADDSLRTLAESSRRNRGQLARAQAEHIHFRNLHVPVFKKIYFGPTPTLAPTSGPSAHAPHGGTPGPAWPPPRTLPPNPRTVIRPGHALRNNPINLNFPKPRVHTTGRITGWTQLPGLQGAVFTQRK